MNNLVSSKDTDSMFVKDLHGGGRNVTPEFLQMLYCDRSITQLLEDK